MLKIKAYLSFSKKIMIKYFQKLFSNFNFKKTLYYIIESNNKQCVTNKRGYIDFYKPNDQNRDKNDDF